MGTARMIVVIVGGEDSGGSGNRCIALLYRMGMYLLREGMWCPN